MAGSAGSHYDRTGRLFILAALGIAFFFAWKVFRPFFSAIALAAIIDILFFPLHERLARALGGRRALAAGITVLLVVLCVILPATAMGFIFTKEALELYQTLGAKAADGSLDEILRYRNWETVEGWLAAHAPWLDVKALNLKGVFLSFLAKISGYGVAVGTAVASNVLSALGTFAVVLFSLFFFLLDGAAFGRWLAGLVPLHQDHQQKLLRTFVEIVKSAVLGSGLVAVVQGNLGGLAFWGVGLHGVLWGPVMAFTSLVPVVGTAVVWIPAAAVLFLQGHTGAGGFLLLWGLLVISNADNVIRMFVVKGPVRMHPLLIFFSVLGGIKLWGLTGVVFGPLALAMVQALLEIFRGEFMASPTVSPE
ncbi:MAG TPA: AI-2E family transporter [Candidatus Methanoperedens sp.]|nr:AI-2E family transporter [Candidatus Methanoperedens sp.]